MVRIRLSRKGKKKMPTYRVVVADIKFARDGRFIENIGHYNPHTNPSTVVIKEDRALYWLSKGAQPSDAVKRFLEQRGTYDRLKRIHAGESIEEVAAEFEPVAAEPVENKASEAKAAVEEVVEEAVEEAEEAVEEVAEEAVEVVEETADAVEEVVEEATEAAEEVAEEAADSE